MEKRKRIIITILLLLSIGNYSRIALNSEIRTVEFISIFVFGFLAGLLTFSMVDLIKSKK